MCKVTINQKEKMNGVHIYLDVQYLRAICTINKDSFVSGIFCAFKYRFHYNNTPTRPRQKDKDYAVGPGGKSINNKNKNPKYFPETNRLQQQLGTCNECHSERGRWYIYEPRYKGTQLICIDTTHKYKPMK